MVRQERNREKVEKRKARKEGRVDGPATVLEGDPAAVVLPSEGSEPVVDKPAADKPAAADGAARPAREAVSSDAQARG
jgi:hypothetical protein